MIKTITLTLLTSLGLSSFLSTPIAAQGDQSAPLTLKDVLALTLKNDQRIEAARYSIKMAQEDVKDARSYFRPKLNGVGNISYSEVPVVNFFGSSTQDGMNLYGGLEVQQEVLSFGRYGSMVRQRKAGVQYNLHALEVTESDVLFEAIQAYLDYSRTLHARQIFQGYADDMRELQKRTQAKFDNQLIGRSELLLVNSRLQQALANVSSNDNSIARAFERLSKLIDQRSYHIPKEPGSLYEAFLPTSLNDAISLALQEDPRIKASIAQVEEKEQAASYAKSNLHPKVTLKAGYTRGNIEGRTTGEAIVGMNISLPIYDGGSGWSRIKRARSDASRARSLLLDERANSEERVTAAWKIYQTILRNEKSWSTALTAEKEAVAEIQKEVDSQVRSLIVLLEAREQLMQAEVNASRAKYSRLLAGYELLIASGKLKFLLAPSF